MSDDKLLNGTEPQEQFTPEPTIWVDQVDKYNGAARYREIDNPDGTITHEPVPLTDDDVITWGTPQSERYFNKVENAALSARLIGNENARHLMQHQRALNRLESENGEAALTNNMQYPFNSSAVTVALRQPMDTTDYTVETDILSHLGNVGRVIISDKQKNGFKMAFTGSATNAVIRWAVKGGKY